MKYLLGMALAVMASSVALADVIGPAEALERARRADGGAVLGVSGRGDDEAPLLTVDGRGDEPALYLFATADGGVAVVSADDEAEALLGYSDRLASVGQLPDNMRAMLAVYADEIARLRRHGSVTTTLAVRPERGAIAPIMTTQWSQDDPYNMYCPRLPDGERAATGCVATAFAQILKTMRYPERCWGGPFSYVSSGLGQTISLNFDDVTLDWDNMLDEYHGGATTAERQAVGRLMYAIGVAGQMDYGPASGTYGSTAMLGLVRNFGYSKSMRRHDRSWYTLADWETLIYDELKDARPVYFDAYDGENAHAFVVDGYKSDGFFHLNWGWGGMSDGYYRLSALSPSEQGIGGSTAPGGYNYGQAIVTGMRPANPNDHTDWADQLQFDCSEPLTPSRKRVSFGARVTFAGGAFNASYLEAVGVTYAMKFESETGATTYVDSYGPYDLPSAYGLIEIEITMPTLAPGTYKVRSAMKNRKGEYFDVLTPPTGIGVVTATVAPGNKYVELTAAPSPELTATFDTAPEQAYSGVPFPVEITLENSGAVVYTDPVCVAIQRQEGKVVGRTTIIGRTPVDLEPGEKMSERIVCHLPDTITPGDYELTVMANGGQRVFASRPLTVGKPEPLTYNLTTLRTVSSARNHLEFSTWLRIKSGNWAEALYVVLFDSDGQYVGYIKTDQLFLSSGASEKVTISGSVEGTTPGARYMAGPYRLTDNEWIQVGELIWLTMGPDEADGIADITADSLDREPMRYYDMTTGRPIAKPRRGSLVIGVDGAGHRTKQLVR